MTLKQLDILTLKNPAYDSYAGVLNEFLKVFFMLLMSPLESEQQTDEDDTPLRSPLGLINWEIIN